VASPFENKYPWYELVGGSEILQGDFLDHCPVLVPTAEAQLELDSDDEIEAERLDTNVVVMSQSCDLQNKVRLGSSLSGIQVHRTIRAGPV
jgi:hypothetical protein